MLAIGSPSPFSKALRISDFATVLQSNSSPIQTGLQSNGSPIPTALQSQLFSNPCCSRSQPFSNPYCSPIIDTCIPSPHETMPSTARPFPIHGRPQIAHGHQIPHPGPALRPPAGHQRGTRRAHRPLAGIPIFGLDALSSAAYGPEAALTLLIPLGLGRRALHRAHQRGHHRPAVHRVLQLSPDHRGLSPRRRFLHRGDAKPRCRRRAAGRGRADDRLHSYRRRRHLRRRRRAHLRRALPCSRTPWSSASASC